MEADMSPQGAVGCFNLSTFHSFQEHRSTELNRATSENLHMYDEGLPAASSSANPFTKLSIPKTTPSIRLPWKQLPVAKLGIGWLFFSCAGQKVTASRPRPFLRKRVTPGVLTRRT